MPAPQTYATHRRRDPLYHFFLLPVFLVTVVVTVRHLMKYPSLHAGWVLILSVAVLLLALQVRIYSLRVQDRLIRLEETLRMSRLLPADLQARVQELTVKQMVGLRFASDAELTDRVREALVEHLDGEAIKKRIQIWRPDVFRV